MRYAGWRPTRKSREFSPYRAAIGTMSALANRAFTKMNGLGNEIVVVDMRASPAPIAAPEARAAAESVAFDQMMALYPPRTPGTEAFVRIYNNDGSESGACGNGMRCIAALICAETGKD